MSFEQLYPVLNTRITTKLKLDFFSAQPIHADLRQVALMTAWIMYSTDPNIPIGFIMKRVHSRLIDVLRARFRETGQLSKDRKTGTRWVFYENEVMPEVVGADDSDDEPVYDEYFHPHHQDHDPAEIRQADIRMDLETTLKKGFETLPEQYHQDMRLFMADIMEGYTGPEIAERRDWKKTYVAWLRQLMRRHFAIGE